MTNRIEENWLERAKIIDRHLTDEFKYMAEAGNDPIGIHWTFCRTFPKIAEDEDLWREAVDGVDWALEEGKPPSWETYREIGEEIYEENGWAVAEEDPEEVLTKAERSENSAVIQEMAKGRIGTTEY